MGIIVTRDQVDLMTPVERRNFIGSSIGSSMATLLWDVRERINSFHLLVRHQMEVAAHNYPNSPQEVQEAKARAEEKIGDELQRTVKMLESLVNQYLKMNGVPSQDTLQFSAETLREAGFHVIPDEVYQAHKESLERGCREYFERHNQSIM